MSDKFSRRDFLKVAGLGLGAMAFKPFDFETEAKIPKSFIFKDNALSSENLGFEIATSYVDRNTLKYTSDLKKPIKLNSLISDSNLQNVDLSPDSLVTNINWIIDPNTKEETSICTLDNNAVVALFASKNMPLYSQVFDLSEENILGTDVLRNHIINIKFHYNNSPLNQESNQYYVCDDFGKLNSVRPNTIDNYQKSPSNVSDHFDVSLSSYSDNEQFIKIANNRVYEVSTSKSSNHLSVFAWESKGFIKVVEFPEAETAFYFDGNRNIPSILCLDNGQIGFVSIDRQAPKFESNKVDISFKIADSRGIISTLVIENPEQKYQLISDFDTNIETEMDVNKINKMLSRSELFNGNPNDILAIFKIRKNRDVILEDTPWLLVYYPDLTGGYKLEELKLPESVTNKFKNKEGPVIVPPETHYS
ncbi:MAG TPA: twin-arginine translocation signal domain-containing protein [Patescibacteria group bacterium]|nr:twin-arginine translocation signal domain-containing protein [Patescibacteria group bacterium]